ncbi:MAG TPA: hypothetical protein VH518_13225 [Tepidisphaeraceae bacterium]|jgi:predicted RNA-binding Zn-ribbon protein involved in translation (DUF1610 family)
MTNLPQDDSRRPLVERVPPTSVASPSELRPRDPADVRWYKPGWSEMIPLMGWRLIFFLPAAGLLSLIFLMPIHAWLSNVIILWWKLLVPAVVLPAGYAFSAANHVIRQRKEPFCIHCGYDLSGLQDNYVCPECGEPYSFRVIDEYRRDPNWFIQRYKKRGDVPPADVPFVAGTPSVRRKRSRDGT